MTGCIHGLQIHAEYNGGLKKAGLSGTVRFPARTWESMSEAMTVSVLVRNEHGETFVHCNSVNASSFWVIIKIQAVPLGSYGINPYGYPP